MSSRRLALVALAVLGCKEAPPPTQVMLVVDAERDAVARIRAVTIAVSGRAKDGERFGTAQSERFEPGADDWPIEVAIVPEGNDASRRYLAVATALDAEGEAISNVATEGGYRKGVVSMLSLVFDASCIANKITCPGQTCRQGACFDIEDGVLRPYSEPRGGDAGAAGEDGGIDGSVVPEEGGMDGGGDPTEAGPGTGDAQVVLDPCAAANGGCAPNMLCRADGGVVDCQDCPSGSLGSDGKCGPALIDLRVSSGELSPAFDSQITEYTAVLPLLVPRVELVVSAPDGTTLTIDEQSVASGQAWTTPELPYGPRAFAIRVADAAGAARAYSLVLERKGEQISYLKASNADVEDDFGRSVAVSGDTIVVGAVFEDSSAEGIDQNAADNAARDSGAVYVFDRDNTGVFRQTAYIKPDDTRTLGYFGSTLDLDGDTLLVGAIGASTDVAGGGAAYVFVREGGSWRQQAKLEPEDGLDDDWFGVCVVLEGDTAIVAAPDRPTAAVYAYQRTGDTWALVHRFTEDGARPGTRFGAAMSLRGDRLLVGAPEDSEVVTTGGAAYVFARSGSTWTQTHELRHGSPVARDWFGYAVSGNDDLIVVGTPYRNGEGLDAGAVFTFARNGGAWEQRQRIDPSSERAETLFGSSVLLTADGLLFVGAQGEGDGGRGVGSPPAAGDDAAPYSGGVYVFRSEAQGFVADSYVKAGNRGADDAFGYVLDIDADLLVVGSLLESSDARTVDGDGANNARHQSGAAYVFR